MFAASRCERRRAEPCYGAQQALRGGPGGASRCALSGGDPGVCSYAVQAIRTPFYVSVCGEVSILSRVSHQTAGSNFGFGPRREPPPAASSKSRARAVGSSVIGVPSVRQESDPRPRKEARRTVLLKLHTCGCTVQTLHVPRPKPAALLQSYKLSCFNLCLVAKSMDIITRVGWRCSRRKNGTLRAMKGRD